jgi:hypothetical protein
MAETARARAFIATTLKGDATFKALAAGIENRIYDRGAPSGAAYPLVRMEILGPGNDLMVVGAQRVWSSPLILVYVTTNAPSTGSIELLADRMDALLHRASGTLAATGAAGAASIWTCIRERPFDLPDDSVSPAVSRLGGEYRVTVTQA